jgi:hypothetical protein
MLLNPCDCLLGKRFIDVLGEFTSKLDAVGHGVRPGHRNRLEEPTRDFELCITLYNEVLYEFFGVAQSEPPCACNMTLVYKVCNHIRLRGQE